MRLLDKEGGRQQAIPCMQLRGGSSKGVFFCALDLPANEEARDQLLLAVMEGLGHGDPRQIDGLGGATSLTSKVAIVSKSVHPDADLDYFFAQIIVGKGTVSTVQTCGNLLAAVLPFAIEYGLIVAGQEETTATINLINTGGMCEVIVKTPAGIVQYAGDTVIDGVQGTAAPIICNYLHEHATTIETLFPSGNKIDLIHDIDVTCIDNGMPVVMLRAEDLDLKGYETKEQLESNEKLKAIIEKIRLQAGLLMHLGHVQDKSVPKMAIISPPTGKSCINTRMFIPYEVHDAIGVLAAISIASACLVSGTVADGIAQIDVRNPIVSIQHPSGTTDIRILVKEGDEPLKIVQAGVLRTARLISKGLVYIP